MDMVLKIAVMLLAFFFMEIVAWFTHKFVMHGFLWILHKDHHERKGKRFEWNDLFALIFAIPSVILILLGVHTLDYRFFIGIGIALYGLAYFLFHDSLVHQRVRIWGNLNTNYLRAVVSAHEEHHMGRKNFGFLILFNWKYFRAEFQKAFYHRNYAG